MGKCMSKLRLTDSQANSHPPVLTDSQNINKKTTKNIQNAQQLKYQQQFDSEIPNRRQVKYWSRKFNLNSNKSQKNAVNAYGVNEQEISYQKFKQFFAYTNFCEENLRKMYQAFKNNKQILDFQGFSQSMRKIATSSEQNLSTFIYSIYFHSIQKPQAMTAIFEDQFRSLFKMSSAQEQMSASLRNSRSMQTISMNPAKLKELTTILEQQQIRRTTVPDQRELERNRALIQKWLKKNVDFRKFRNFILEGDIVSDEKLAYQQFWVDYNLGQSKIGHNQDMVYGVGKDGQVTIVNWRWCEKMLKYLSQKYQIQGVPKLRRRPTIDVQSIKLNGRVSRKDSLSLQVMKSNIIGEKRQSINENPHSQLLNKNNNFINRIPSRQEPARSTLFTNSNYAKNPAFFQNPKSFMKITEKQRGIQNSYPFMNYPGQIDNHILIGNFQEELKRNIRKDVDYITIRQQTFDKLMLCFGGGPKIKRKIIQGYIQLRPYFMCIYEFKIDQLTNQIKMVQKQSIALSSNDLVSSFVTDQNISNKFNFSVNTYYHKNMGEQWNKFPFEQAKQNQKILDTLSQTSFLVYMSPIFESAFKKLYPNKKKSIQIGQVYTSKSYKILDSIEERTLSNQIIQVCIVNDQQAKFVEFVVLNWNHHIKRKVYVKDFQENFELVQNKINVGFFSKGSAGDGARAGIANLGNTCYMNASIQAILSSCKQEYLSRPKGMLGNQLLQIAKKITQKKKSVFPVDFKTAFDKYYSQFKGQDQQDAHEFTLKLFQQFEKDNKSLIERILDLKFKFTVQCLNCKKIQQNIQQAKIISFPLRDFAKKQVKVDYIRQNKTIQTVKFNVKEDCTVEEWRINFEKASGAKDYYLCQVENGLITRTFNRWDKIDNQFYKDLNIQNHFLISAYETKAVNYDIKLDKIYDFRTYKDSKGNYHIVRIQLEKKQQAQNPLSKTNRDQVSQQNQLTVSTNQLANSTPTTVIVNGQNQIVLQRNQPQIPSIANIPPTVPPLNFAQQPDSYNTPRIRVKIPNGNQFQIKTLRETQLTKFPQNYPYRQTYINIINYDDSYNEYIGRPFILKLPEYLPIRAVRLALQSFIPSNLKYSLRLTPLNQPSKCQICKNRNAMLTSTSTNIPIFMQAEQNSKCFRERQLYAPICWVNGRLDFVIGWTNAGDCKSVFLKESKIYQNGTNGIGTQNMLQNDEYDTFQDCLKKISEPQIAQDYKCDKCNKIGNAELRTSIFKIPEVLILHLQRFKVTYNQRSAQLQASITKIHTKWRLQPIIYLNKTKYTLKAVLCHIGTSADYGHYVTIAGGFCYNDQLVSRKEFTQIAGQEIYMMFYVIDQ